MTKQLRILKTSCCLALIELANGISWAGERSWAGIILDSPAFIDI